MNVIDFLRDYGKLINVNYMLAKDTIASRLETGFPLRSFLTHYCKELTLIIYMIITVFAFKWVVRTNGGILQQVLEIIRKTHDEEAKAYGITMPFVTKADGTKFGKTAGGAVWLDAEKTIHMNFTNSGSTQPMRM